MLVVYYYWVVLNMLKVKQHFCRHDFKQIAKHRNSQMNLWKCSKCNVWLIQHYGIELSYKCKVPNILQGWDTNWKQL